jgi:hypothetical protein
MTRLGGVLVLAILAACGNGPSETSDRVDLETPVFSHPTEITNPLFPILACIVQAGHDADQELRVEVTSAGEQRKIDWEGGSVDVVVSEFVSYLDGELAETASDYFAQADDGSVWYFGEDVSNYENGAVKDHDGSWLAGRDGPPGMIMPADPEVGDVYRPENIPGLVFEEVTVLETALTIDTPSGEVDGAIRVRERLDDGTTEEKLYVPGFGEFRAETEDELYEVTATDGCR